MDDLINRKTVINGLDYIITELDKLIEEDPLNAEYHHTKKQVEEIKNGVQKLPSAQPEIIRCKDCKNWDTTWQNDWAKNYHYCPLIDGIRNGDWYCADAERRTDE